MRYPFRVLKWCGGQVVDNGADGAVEPKLTARNCRELQNFGKEVVDAFFCSSTPTNAIFCQQPYRLTG
jgi:hypothetical protein